VGCQRAPAQATQQAGQMPQSKALVLVNGTLIDGTGAAPLRDAVLVLRDGRIEAVGECCKVTIPTDVQVIDVHGATILPGFINAHVHEGYSQDNLAAWARAGVTTVRDLSARSVPAPYALRNQMATEAKCARLVVVGSMITVPGGYPIAYWHAPAVTVTNVVEAQQAANTMLDQGADVLKIALESGVVFGQSGWPMLSLQQVRAIVDAAHARGTRVSAHVSVSPDLRAALDGGVDDVAHMVTDLVPDELIARMVHSGTYWVPTLELWKGVAPGVGAHVIENLRRFVAAGGQVALGTDYGGAAMQFQLGMPMREIEWMQAAGMSPLQIIIAATRNAAHVCNLERELGTLEPGKAADVLVVQGDPLRDLHALEQVGWVIDNGAVIRAEEH
jgi:enamidase